jgi:shikimate dehydrogenase
LPIRYETVDVAPAALESTLDGLIAENAWGNVTIPHKEHVAARCARRSALAERVGAVNTFWIEDGQLVGDHTDVGGFLELRAATAPDREGAAAVGGLGAGGAAAAVIAALEQTGRSDVRVRGRSHERAAALCARFSGARAVRDLSAALRGAALVVNATPTGLDGHSVPVSLEMVEPGAVVLDLVVGPNETPFVRAARERGHRAADGLEKLLGQREIASQRLFDLAPDRGAMREADGRNRIA